MNHVVEADARQRESKFWGKWRESIKGLGKRKVPFAEIAASGFPGASVFGGGLGGFGNGWGGSSPGSTYDYTTAAGELWENRVVAACVNAISQALSDAPPYLEKREGTAWVKLETHPVIELLNAPNGYYGSPHLWSATAASECTAGQAFWRIEKSRAGLPAELWWEDARRFRALGDADTFIKGYRFQTERGGWVELANDEVIHFRYALNPYNPREGRTPLTAGLRQVALDNGIASYSGSILRNSGVMSLLISAKDATSGAQITPAQIQDFVDKLKQRLFGDGAGGIAGLNLPLDVQKMSYSPDEMAVDKLTNYAEASICALLGVDPMVCGLGSGTLQKTYANMAEALNDFWERRIIPTKNRHSAELGAQLLPLYGLDCRDYRIAWDYSRVAALLENEDQKHARVRADYQAGLIDLYEAQTALGLLSDESRRGVYCGEGQGEDAFKAVWREELHPRDWRGRFAGSGANPWVERRARTPSGSELLTTGETFGAGTYLVRPDGAKPAFDLDTAHDDPEQRLHEHYDKHFHDLGRFSYVYDGIEHGKRKIYDEAMKSVLRFMPMQAKRLAVQHVKRIHFHESTQKLNTVLERIEGRKLDPPAIGGYYRLGQALHLDGAAGNYPIEEIFAHEMGHAIDGPDKAISQTQEWTRAWKEELCVAGLPRQAAISESEGFAEFARLMFSRELPATIKKRFPLCFEVWRAHNLVE